MTFDFGASSYRETFFSTSSFRFNFGFLTTPAITYRTRGDFRCLIYENTNGTLVLSRTWKTLTVADLAAVTVSPKQQISNPNSIKYTMQCYGTGVPTGSNTTSMSLSWRDNNLDVQVGTSIPTLSYLTSTLTALSTFTL